MKTLFVLVLISFSACTSQKSTVIYMPFLPPDADSAGRDLFQFYGYEDTLGRWHEWGNPRWKRTLNIPPRTPGKEANEGAIPPMRFFKSYWRIPPFPGDTL